MSEPFIAEVRMFANDYAPQYWASCDGQLMGVSQNTALFSLVGSLYGGDGRTTFGIPNLQGRAAMHSGTGPGLTSRQVGQFGGTPAYVLSESEMPTHTHSITGLTGGGNLNSPDDGAYLAVDTNAQMRLRFLSSAPNSDRSMDLMALSNAGGGAAHENRQPYLVVNYCMALTGFYPSRN